MNGWIGVDFDGTLSVYDGWVSPTDCGAPVPAMVERVKAWRAEGKEVRIFTARIFPITVVCEPGFDFSALKTFSSGRHVQAVEALNAIQAWCLQHLGEVLAVTCVKDYSMLALYDDRAIQVKLNTGELVGSRVKD